MMTFIAVLIVLATAAIIAWFLAGASARTGGALLGDAVDTEFGERNTPPGAAGSRTAKSFAATPFATASLAAETRTPETLAPEVLVPETLAPETLAPETFPGGSLALRRGLAEETHA